VSRNPAPFFSLLNRKFFEIISYHESNVQDQKGEQMKSGNFAAQCKFLPEIVIICMDLYDFTCRMQF
jgi:hypothetical protein